MQTLHTFSSLTLPELAPILAIMAGMLVGFYGLLKFVLNKAEKAGEADRVERQELTKAIAGMASAMQDVATSNARIADESKERNGHLGELIIEQGKQANVLADTAIKKVIQGVQNVKTQKVVHQTVENETVLNKE